MDCAMSTYIKAAQSAAMSSTTAITASSRRYHLPIHIGDWLRETRHLSPIERDGYLHLKIEYWSRGSLPDDDAQLSRIAGMTMAQWRRAKPAIEKLFLPSWRHERLDAELVRVEQISAANTKKARQAARTRWGSDASSIQQACSEHAPSKADAVLQDKQPVTRDHNSPSESVTSPSAPALPLGDQVVGGQGKKSNALTRLREDWKATDRDRTWAKTQGLDDGQINHAEGKFRDHWLQAPDRTGKKKDWAAAWRTWITNEIDWRKGAHNLPRAQAPARIGPAPVRIKVFVGTPQWAAWEKHWRQNRGGPPPEIDVPDETGRLKRGYMFVSEFPPPDEIKRAA